MIVQDKFAFIEDIEDLECLKAKDEFNFKEEFDNTIVSYMVADKETFDSLVALEGRGITFDKDGNIASRPLHKFFNVGEKEETFPENLSLDKVVGVFDKVDGSMIHPVWTKNGIVHKTKKSFESGVAKEVQDFVVFRGLKGDRIYRLDKEMLRANLTPVYEWVSPTTRIVLKYNKPELTLLHIRDNFTGEYLNPREVDHIAERFSVPRPTVSLDQSEVDAIYAEGFYKAKEILEPMENYEGIVVQFDNGEMVKLKTPWYLQLHRAVSFSRERDIVEMVLDETIDDHKSMLHEAGEDIKKVERVEHKVKNELLYLKEKIDLVLYHDGHMNQKDFAIKYKDHPDYAPYFSLIMQAYNGKEPRIVEWFRKNRLKDFGLETVV